MLASGEIDAVAVTGYFGGYALYSHDYVRSEPAEAARLVALQESTGSPVVAHSMYAPDSSGAALRATGLAVFERTEQAVRALARARDASPRSDPRRLRCRCRAAAAPLSGAVGYVEARALFAGSRVCRTPMEPSPAMRPARSRPQIASASTPPRSRPSTRRWCTSPIAGACASGCRTPPRCTPPRSRWSACSRPERLFVERTAIVADGVELIVGARQDARFGPVVLVGLGGTLVEVLGDTALALAPIDAAAAGEAARIAARRARCCAACAVVRQSISTPPRPPSPPLSRVAAAHPELAELEVNPLLVTPSGACALDARAILAAP